MEKTDITIITSILNVLIGSGLLTLLFEMRKSRKTVFVDSITSQRKEFLQNFRQLTAEYCTLALTLRYADKDKKQLQRMYQVKCSILLLLNPDDEWDKETSCYLNRIYKQVCRDSADEQELDTNINKLILIVQYQCRIEWKGMRQEAKDGAISDTKRTRIRNDVRKEYHKSKRNNVKPLNIIDYEKEL
jgi:viroplasmin and RNaseH domain-containing protein